MFIKRLGKIILLGEAKIGKNDTINKLMRTIIFVLPFILFYACSWHGFPLPKTTTQQAQPAYFPANVFSKRADLHNFINSWYSRQLTALQEPSLYTSEPPHHVYRFTWLRSFHPPIAIRIELPSHSLGTLTAKRTDGAGGYEPGEVDLNTSFELTPSETQEFLSKIEQCQFWRLPTREEVDGLDGARWIIEGKQETRYHIVDRWSPEKGCVRELGLYFLKLSRINVKEIY